MKTNDRRKNFTVSATDCSILSRYRAEIYGAAILWIMLFHGYLVKVEYFSGIPALQYVGRLMHYGNAGVECFLFLSGIGLYYSYQKNRDLYAYTVRRIKKVYPPVWLIGGAYWVGMHFYEGLAWRRVVLSLSGWEFWFDGNQEIWFVSLILLCYLLYPFLYAFLYRPVGDDGHGSTDKRVFLRAMGLMLVLMIVILCIRGTPESRKNYKMVEIALTRIPVFVLGCGCGKWVYEKRKIPAILWILFAAMLVLSLIVLEADVLHGPWRRWWYMTAGVPLVFLLAGFMRYVPEWLKVFLRFLGNMSLELYVMHLALKRLYERNLLPVAYQAGSARRWLVIIGISILLSYVVKKIEDTICKRIA